MNSTEKCTDHRIVEIGTRDNVRQYVSREWSNRGLATARARLDQCGIDFNDRSTRALAILWNMLEALSL
jgi:hypothetical protein